MRIGYFAVGAGPHLDIAKHLIASVKRVMPKVEIFQLTDETTPVLEGAKAVRSAGNMPMGIKRLEHYANLSGEWCFVDTDVLFRKDVQDVFEKPFDVALVSREGTYMHGTEYAQLMPYNFGVVFSKNAEFWKALLPHMKKLSPEMQRWGGEQFLTCQLAGTDGHFSVEILPSTYNFTPLKKDDDISEVAILHLKGPRKAWITTLAQAA
jgi:hypothetical protein